MKKIVKLTESQLKKVIENVLLKESDYGDQSNHWEEMKRIRSLPKEYYPPSESMEYYDEKTDTFFNRGGQQLRHSSEYDKDSEGYTPFGDEG